MRNIILAAALLAPLAAEAAPLRYFAELKDLNPNDSSDVSGRADLWLRGDMLTVSVRASGLAPNQLHVQHIHGRIDDDGVPVDSVSPTLAGADSDGDGVLELIEGLPLYGPIVMSLKDDAFADPFEGFAAVGDDGVLAFDFIYDLRATTAFSAGFGIEQLLPLGKREIVLHGGFLDPGIGVATDRPGPEEGDGLGGYRAFLPVAAGELQAVAPVPLPAAAWMLLAGIGALGAVRLRR
jgi:hypothetical protein